MDKAWVYKKHAKKAIASIERNGCYWFDERRPYYSIVQNILQEAGYSVLIFNPPPHFEYVLYPEKSAPSYSEVCAIAKLRADMRVLGISEEELPTSLV
ncbi:TPA: hypothetical protein ACPFO3_004852 [Escherichia coli]|uniref:hypothetical protein n=1 Tax=Escherichia albertii TaxID=208962 RepID=UPI0017DDC6CB|nr:hypothetical protein [Escherichia albertii]EFK8694389.1 hypothetical protein [Escherichia coli]EHP8181204.1 hypothetical protein [Escherichia coli]EIU0577876.1 hypothetical protein [Escherichia coli]EIU0643639.1 hypothetical protein [Escherichia coli]EJC0489496.1 hypothetical protein [Escherichia coli]